MPIDDKKFEELLAASGLISVFVWENAPGWPVHYVTDNVVRLLGITKQEFEGQQVSYDDLIHPDDSARVHAEIYAATSDKSMPESFTHQDYRLFHKNGKVVWVTDTTIMERNEQGKVTQFFGYIVDITTQKEAELEARRSAQAKNVFLANISHEIRTPLHGILGITDVLSRTALDAKQREMLNTVKRSGDYLLNTLNDILDFIGAEEGKFRLMPKLGDPREMVNHLHSLFGKTIIEKQLTFSVRVAPNVPAKLYLDHARLLQVASNLLSNAIKFTDRGYIELALSKQQNNANGGTELVLTVADSGIGISDTQRIWAMFEQEELALNKRRSGSGLGLPIVRSLVKLMHGRIEVESEPGTGARFTVSIPIDGASKSGDSNNQPSGEGALPIAQQQKLPNAQGNILIVDDSRVNQLIIGEMLTTMNYSATSLTDAKTVLAHLSEHEYSVIFMDIHMPDIDGLELTRRIRQLPLASQPYIIALTANAFDDMREASMTAGMNDYVTKPFLREHIIGALRKAWQNDS